MPYLGSLVEYFDAMFKFLLSFIFDDLPKANVISEEEETIEKNQTNGSPQRKRESTTSIRKKKVVMEENTPA